MTAATTITTMLDAYLTFIVSRTIFTYCATTDVTIENAVTNVRIDDLQEQHKEIAEAVGVAGLISLTDVFGGSSIYIPQRKELIKNRVYGNLHMKIAIYSSLYMAILPVYL